MDLGGVQPGEGLLEAVDFLNGGVGQHPGGALVGTLLSRFISLHLRRNGSEGLMRSSTSS